MELLQLTYFCDAAKTENFSHTAEKFNVPASNISQTVKRLEEELGVKLFRRSANKIFLSEEGRIFYEGAKRALDALSTAKNRLADIDGSGKGEIRLLIQTCRRVVTNAIERYKQKFPGVSISINHNPSDGTQDYDFIISDSVDDPSEYVSRFLVTEKILLAAKADSAVALKPPKALSELECERFIALDNSRLFGFTEQLCKNEGFSPNVVIRTDDPYYVRKYVEMGLGVALIPSVSWRGQFSDEVSLIDIGAYKRETNLFIKREKILTGYERAFADILVEIFYEEGKK